MKDEKNKIKAMLYFSAIALFALVSCYLIFGMIDYRRSNVFLAIFWMAGFFILTLNVGYMLVSSAAAFMTRNKPFLKEEKLARLPKTAIVYVIRNEDKDVIIENLTSSFKANFEENVDLWLLSNSDAAYSLERENEIASELPEIFGKGRFYYFRTHDNPLRRKHVCIRQWLESNPQYKYFTVCDADSVLPAGSVRKLVSKAEHPENASVALFQSHITITRKTTYFSQLLGFGQDICQRIYSRANQNVFGGGVSYGSGCLIRSEAFRKINVPDWVLSHDIWDTVALEENGFRTAFCSDVVTCGIYPANYIEYLKRSRRWIKGTLESIPTCLKSKISAGTRFMVLYPSYMYAIQPLFFLWILSGFFYNNKMMEPMLVTQKFAFLGGSFVDLEMGSHLLFTMGIISGHRFAKCRNLDEARRIIIEFITTMLLCLNSIFFDSITVIKLLFSRNKGISWVPMKKSRNQDLSIKEVVLELWPIAVLGLIGLAAGIMYNPLWTLCASPFILSFVLGIPAAYLTAKKVNL